MLILSYAQREKKREFTLPSQDLTCKEWQYKALFISVVISSVVEKSHPDT